MNLAAINHRSAFTDSYCFDENTIEINLRTGNDVDSVKLVWEDPYAFRKKERGFWDGEKSPMKLEYQLKNNRVWNCKVQPFFKRLSYYFEITAGNETVYLFENNFATPEEHSANPWAYNRYKMSWMNQNDIARVPEWVPQTVWYQIMPDRFCSKGNHYKRLVNKAWGDETNGTYGDIYGGDLKGIIEKLDYIKELGFSGIYFLPLFKSNSNHKYNIEDYYQIDPDFGTEEDMKTLVEEAHKRGIKIMLDAVFNHCGTAFPQWQDVLKNREKSKYKDWFFVNDYEKLDSTGDTSDGRYYSFDFVKEMPKLNTNNPEVQEYFINLCAHWVKDFKVDALRFDVADELSHDFLKNLRREMHKINPQIFLLGEIWIDSLKWLTGDQFDSIMNYPFANALNTYFGNRQTTTKDLSDSLQKIYSMYYRQYNQSLFNFIDTHDTERAIHSVRNIYEFFQKICFLLTNQGSSCILYGTEIALEGKEGPGKRKCMPWNQIESGKFTVIQGIMKQLISLRNDYAQLRSEEIEFIEEKNPRLLHYIKGKKIDAVVVYMNTSDNDEQIELKGEEIFSSNFNRLNNNSGIIKAGGIYMENVKSLRAD